eukprot:TRINITY_DN47272_c0_g1_i1.p1 TRINITY_DN47272_c0_g1~~TRINITY_DN47272_c0_g1_i1.p1  ORF type:complete len:257 (-),score=63.65 TRINITY_DN47272_c0_g1_i1:215-985(-)
MASAGPDVLLQPPRTSGGAQPLLATAAASRGGKSALVKAYVWHRRACDAAEEEEQASSPLTGCLGSWSSSRSRQGLARCKPWGSAAQGRVPGPDEDCVWGCLPDVVLLRISAFSDLVIGMRFAATGSAVRDMTGAAVEVLGRAIRHMEAEHEANVEALQNERKLQKTRFSSAQTAYAAALLSLAPMRGSAAQMQGRQPQVSQVLQRLEQGCSAEKATAAEAEHNRRLDAAACRRRQREQEARTSLAEGKLVFAACE